MFLISTRFSLSKSSVTSGIISFEEGHKNEDKNSPNYYTITTPSGKQYTRHWFVDKEEAQNQKSALQKYRKGLLSSGQYWIENNCLRSSYGGEWKAVETV